MRAHDVCAIMQALLLLVVVLLSVVGVAGGGGGHVMERERVRTHLLCCSRRRARRSTGRDHHAMGRLYDLFLLLLLIVPRPCLAPFRFATYKSSVEVKEGSGSCRLSALASRATHSPRPAKLCSPLTIAMDISDSDIPVMVVFV